MKKSLRNDELYTHAPVTVSFPEAEERQVIRVVVTPVDSIMVRLSGFSLAVGGGEVHSEEVLDVRLNDTVSTPIGPMVITPTLYYTDVFSCRAGNVVKVNKESVVGSYCKGLRGGGARGAAAGGGGGGGGVSIARAEDILNMLIAVYNEDVINDKNQIAVNTSKFINERLIIIERELGSVDANIENFKRENQLTDITSETGMYLANTSRYQQEGLSLENQLSIVRYIKEYLTDPQKNSDLIPANTGISDNSVDSQIKEPYEEN